MFTPTAFHRQFSAQIKPVLTVAPGDTIATWTVDAGGSDARGTARSLGGNPQTGPFYIDGADRTRSKPLHPARAMRGWLWLARGGCSEKPRVRVSCGSRKGGRL